MNTIELTEYAQSIANDIVKRRKIKPVNVSVKNIRQGHARSSRNASIPLWAYSKYGMDYFTYYVVHEVCHFITGYSHDSDFKRAERHELKLKGLEIEYRRAYPRRLVANGQTCYERSK